MKKTLITLAALAMASVAQATNFYWQGGSESDWTTAYAWNTDAGNVQWIPTAGDCNVYVGTNTAQSGNVTWNAKDWDLASLSIGGNSSVTFTGWGDFKVETIAIAAGSSLTLSCDNAIGGFEGTTTMDLSGAITDATPTMFTMASTGGSFWGGDDKVLKLTGTLDLSSLPNALGEITLVDIAPNSWAGGLTVDYSSLVLSGAPAYSQASLAWVGTEGGTGKLVLSYVPEPTTATLSLLALAGLAARRRRK